MDYLSVTCTLDSPQGCEDLFPEYVTYMEKLIRQALPVSNDEINEGNIKAAFHKIKSALPILQFSDPDKAPCSFQIFIIAQAEYTDGVGRFLCDMANRWLIPGKQIPLGISKSLRFRFRYGPDMDFFAYAVVAYIQDDQELQIVKRHVPNLKEEIKTIVRAVVHARRTISSETIGMEHKRAFIEENLLSLLDRPLKDFDQSVYDTMHQFFIRVSSEYNIGKIKENFAALARKAPRQVDRDIFNEIQHYVLLFRDVFMSKRARYHLYRLISYKYLFRKAIAYSIRENPNQRYMPIKFLPTKLDETKPVLGLVIGLNSLNENEVFEARHILAGVRTYLPDALLVPDSYIVDTRKDANVRTYYVEFKKKDDTPFRAKEIGRLRKKLSKELPSRIESITHSLFVHRNEEEVMRNILILARQLKFVKDIPQVIVTFEKQTASSLCFTVIMLRLLHTKSRPLKSLLESSKHRFTFYDYDVKIVGTLRKKYPKEANVFEIRVDKHLYLRNDNSIDVNKARQDVIAKLVTLTGEVRDFNGGMITKQVESLAELREAISAEGIQNDFVLENFFYSTVPTYMQSVIPTEQYKKLFFMLTALAETGLQSKTYQLHTNVDDEFCLIAIGSTQGAYKDALSISVETLGIPGSELCATSVNVYDMICVGYLYRYSEKCEAEKLIATVKESLTAWEKTCRKPVDILTQTLMSSTQT